MNIEIWHEKFIKALDERYPKRSQLIQALMDLLCIERESVYRRLRNDVAFSIYEIAKISMAWNISVDRIIGVNSGLIPFLMQPINFINPSEQELNFLRHVTKSIGFLKDFPDTEFMDVCNRLPRQILAGYEYLNQFYLFKWNYLYNNEKITIPFSQIVISEEKRQLTVDYCQAIKNVPQSNFIFDLRIFENMINDIHYFYAIQMITDEEKELIKKDLSDLLDYLFEVASNGCYPETKSKVNIYISQLAIDTNYSYTYTNQANICFIHVFDKYDIYTYEPEIVENFRNWMQLKKRTSIKISEVDEKSKIEFFAKQRELMDSL